MSNTNEPGNTNQGGPNRINASSGKLSASKLQDLFEAELKDIYWAENALIEAIPKMIENASSPQLTNALAKHLLETKNHVRRLDNVFASIEMEPAEEECEAMAGLIGEAEELMEETEEGAQRDAAIIAAGQKIEHYEIASYGTMRTFAQILGLSEATALLESTLNEEKAADEKLTEIAVSTINIQAAEEDN